ncbi:TonB-dependent receptor [Aestuariirhabdus sp. Z084]|uniref:TonB-dependent receptor domain-containing protein n=1 Tax=Aestuariirhabdus haliotis TaxID=2918751 RepID=UPI00201B3740|nr:TonB-dependent receptor [Aestuariirhabdus haliotis]MCL6415084.1 TonB-dependent receptor [Aestuariirhabdus haliotis]MCL6419016.1 TonB-dependent receptor [Aestuariirhabdus haliotis]
MLTVTPKRCAVAIMLAGSSAIPTQTIFADEVPVENVQSEPVVVVGQATNTVVTPEALETYQANDLSDVFRHVPSVSVGGSVGIAQKIYIRGLEDTLINVTVDGAPQTSSLFHHIGRVSIEPELLQAVEVQAGAGEATSGAGAIGGAIRFKTKSASDLLRDGEQFGSIVKAGYFSNDGHKTSVTGYGKLTEDWGMLASFTRLDSDNMEDGRGNELYGTEADQKLGFIKFNGELTDDQSISLSYEQRNEDGDFGARPNWPVLENDDLFPMDGVRKTGVINHRLNSSDWINLETTAYYTESTIEQDRYDRWGRYEGSIETYGFDVRNITYLDSHTLTYGADYRHDEASSKYLDDPSVWQGWAWDPAIGSFKEKGSVEGVYIQNHWQITDQMLLSFGSRYDNYELKQVTYNHDTDSNGFSNNIGLAYALSGDWTLTAGYAEARRGKEVGDTFTLEHNPNAVSLQPGLDAETVENFEFGLEYHGDNLYSKLSLYRSNIYDVIYDQQGRGAAPEDSTYYENIGKLKTDGLELLIGYQWDALNLQASYHTMNTELNGNDVEGYEHVGLGNSLGDTWNLNLVYSLSDSIEMGWHFTYVESLKNVEVLHRSAELGWIGETQRIDKPSYQVHDIYVQWLPLNDDRLTLNFTVQNLFDEYYRDHASVGDYSEIAGWETVAGLYEPGRDVRLSVSYKY